NERLGGPGQWLVTLPLHLVSGVQMLSRSILAGTEPVFLGQPADDDRFLAAAASLSAERRYVSLVPVQFARLLERAEGDGAAAAALRRFDAILVGGQAVPRTLRQRAHELDLRLFRSYGMTETAGGCVYDGVEIGDTLVRIRGGEIQLAGPSLASGYLGDPEQTAARFFVEDDTRWYRTGDAGELLGGMLTVLGRLDNVIVSGGVNVSLDEVERVVHELPGWGEAVAVGVPDDTWGERVALVRAAEPAAAEPEDPSARIRAELGVAAIPARFEALAELPRLPGGKADRVAIRARLTGAPAPR
ncbi:AMP-binding protein, partial [Leucobacter sp. M11]|uniref:AMP-binding protein n=1 Tax=Leucobacter sp. M11 TaxID=2993565 RepID=UPI002D7FB36B